MPNPAPHVLIVAGDPSGDQHGATLAQTLKRRNPRLTISALGGAHLRQVADHFLYPLVGVGGFGFWEPLAQLPQLWKAWRTVKRLLKDDAPDGVVPIDYYGFNIHVARHAHARQIPVIYYISPQVWASRPGRIRELAKVLNKMLVLFPFEADLYRQAGIPVQFVGHPLLDCIPPPDPSHGLGDKGRGPAIGLLPGSRRNVAARHLPILVETSRQLRKTYAQADYIVFRPSELEPSFYQAFLAAAPWIRLVHDPRYEERKKLQLAITVSGTAALESALLGTPMIVMYKLSPLTYAIAQRLIRVPFVALPNLLASKAVVPELLQAEATPEKLAAAARALLGNPAAWQTMRDQLMALRASLGDGGVSERAAQEIEKTALRERVSR